MNSTYGPHSSAVLAVFETLSNIPWFSAVGQSLCTDANYVAVPNWHAAIAPLADRKSYGPNGHLSKPSARSITIIESAAYRPWWIQARDDVYDYFAPSECLDLRWDPPMRDWMHEYVYEFISFLLAEIIGPKPDVIYFQSMLNWFRAGRFPAGWQEDWPHGKMRVY